MGIIHMDKPNMLPQPDSIQFNPITNVCFDAATVAAGAAVALAPTASYRLGWAGLADREARKENEEAAWDGRTSRV